jgi:hypothetical protein
MLKFVDIGQGLAIVTVFMSLANGDQNPVAIIGVEAIGDKKIFRQVKLSEWRAFLCFDNFFIVTQI